MVQLRIGTRGSTLAMRQAREACDALAGLGIRSDLVAVRTSGDAGGDRQVDESGGKRIFVRELEEALLDGRIDLAVHSCKDLPAALPEGLVLAAALPRADVRDALVLPRGALAPVGLADLTRATPPSPRVGTGSLRRSVQLAPILPGARFQQIRGNVESRLRRLDLGEYDLLVLAEAGLARLGAEDRPRLLVPLDQCLPAPGQGAIVLEARVDDGSTRSLAARVDHEPTSLAVAAERAFVEGIGAGCHSPVGAHAVAEDGWLTLSAAVFSVDGRDVVRGVEQGPSGDAAVIGGRLARRFLARGAASLLVRQKR